MPIGGGRMVIGGGGKGDPPQRESLKCLEGPVMSRAFCF